jgi:hypothetical protein
VGSTESDTKILVSMLGILLFIFILGTVVLAFLADFFSGLCGFSPQPAKCDESHPLAWVLWIGAGGPLLLGMLMIGRRRAKGPEGMRLMGLSMTASATMVALSIVAG